MRISIPIVSDLGRVRLGFLLSALDSLFKNSRVEHDVVIVSNDGESPEFLEAVKPWPVRVVPVSTSYIIERDGRPVGSRLYEYLNIGAKHAMTEWLLTPPGDDSYFFPNWENLLDWVDSSIAEENIWTPTLFETYPHHVPIISYDRPLEVRVGWTEPRMKESEVLAFAREHCPKSKEVRVEAPNERIIAHWANTLQHVNLYWRVGGFREHPPLPDSHDLHLHDDYSHFGVKKFCVSHAVIGNCRVAIELGQ